jgi:hypothetical protein
MNDRLGKNQITLELISIEGGGFVDSAIQIRLSTQEQDLR